MMNEQMRALQEILEQSQWNSLQDNLVKQQTHFMRLLEHAFASVPFYKKQYVDCFSQGLSDIGQLPVLSRAQLKEMNSEIISEKLPDFHGATYPMETSGSTGQSVKILATDFTRLFHDSLMLREHAWHQRDFSKKLMAILWAKKDFANAPIGYNQDSWGPPINQYKKTGPSTFINVASSTQSQINALLFYKPQYLMTYPSQLAALAQYCLTNNIYVSFLEAARTTGETLSADYISLIKAAWPTIKLADVYSSVEIGIMAQQCSEYNNYHVNLENTYLEIVDVHNQPCKIGQPGKVLVTSLLNYATPLIRYEIGDYAEWGEPCACGRGLPVIKKILGRTRNRLILPNGESRFPYLGDRREYWEITRSIKKFQFVQHSVMEIEFKIISEKLTAVQEAAIIQLHKKNLGSHFRFAITYHDQLSVGPTGKFEEFVSLV